jgi:hypothetical protein
MKRSPILLLFSLLLATCGPSPEQLTATVMAGIAQTQTAVPLPSPTPTAPLPTVTPLPSPTSTPAPVSLGGSNQILLGVAQCLPGEQAGCAYESLGIYLSNPDGSVQQQLLGNGNINGLSPDGSKVLVSQPGADGGQTLSVLTLAGSKLLLLSAIYENEYLCDLSRCGAIWLPDGKRVAFIATLYNEKNIFLVNADGSGMIQLTWPNSNSQPIYLYPAPSNDHIFWAKGSAGVAEGVLTARLDGAEQKQIEKIHDPAFSPNGAQVAYLKSTNDLGFQEGFFVAAADWTNETQIYAPKINESVDVYSWSPDSSRIVFSVSLCTPKCDTSKYYLWTTSGVGLVELPAVVGQSLSAPTWSSNGQNILINSYDKVLSQHSYQVLNLDSRTLQPILEKFPLPEGGYFESMWVKP